MPQYYIPKDDFKIVYKEDIEPYIYNSDKEMRFLIALVWLTGLRIGDTLRLGTNNVHINEALRDIVITIRASKGGTLANPSFSFDDPFVDNLILPYIRLLETGNLFTRGKRRCQQKLQQLNVKIHGNETSKYITFHYLRHSRITHLARVLRAFPEEIKAWTGHRTTQFETYIAPRKVERFRGRLGE